MNSSPPLKDGDVIIESALMFNPVTSRVNLPEMEQRILQFWNDRRIFQRSIDIRQGCPQFTVFEGPPTANGKPGIHHVLPRVFKDVIPRYKTMKGFQVPRKAGWDTHGLPVELEIEKELGLKSKPEIEAYGIAKFNEKCRQSVLRYIDDWNKLTERIGYWTDLDHPYWTFDNNYIESCWWIIKQLWGKGLVYQGYRVTPHCPRCSTSLSSHEVALGYKDDTDDPSVYVKFKLADKSMPQLNALGARKDLPTYLLAWTTTPWTLPGNTALAIAPNEEYVLIEIETDNRKEQLILARDRLESTITNNYEVIITCKGQIIADLQYEPLYNPAKVSYDVMAFQEQQDSRIKLEATTVSEQPADLTYPVITGEFVTMEEGTGIVHIAPAFGEVDFQAGRENKLYFLQAVDLSGKMTISIPWLDDTDNIKGLFVKDADPLILKDLKSRGHIYRSERIKHTYPFCWRCQSPLLYYAKSSWYIKTTAIKERLISANKEINWYPEHIKLGRFGDWLENNVDWAFSRERYWGTPLPVWECGKCGSQECIDSREDLIKKKLQQTTSSNQLFAGELDLHRPFIDDILFDCEKCGGTMHRVPEVIDCWFDSGAMPVAQWHYPFENETIRKDGRFPADFISEAVDQTRGWFYSLHAISTLIFSEPCYKNVICLGLIHDDKGEKMSKSKGNVIDPWVMLNKYSADALRWYLFTSAPPGNVRRFSEKGIAEVTRKFLMTLWNIYSFFITYANIDNYNPVVSPDVTEHRTDLDKWILSELHQLISDVTRALDNYNPTGAGRKVEDFIDSLSNWYIRRCRRRFWKSGSDADKLAAYATLYECLITLTRLLAPFTPFIAEELYQNLIRTVNHEAAESVHLTEFPVVNQDLINEQLSLHTRAAIKVASLGRAARSQAGLKVRQPLAKVVIKVKDENEKEGIIALAAQILEELNVKEIDFVENENDLTGQPGYVIASEAGYTVGLTTDISQELADEGMARELVHRIQMMRRSAGFDITDHIVTYYQGNESIQRVMDAYSDYIKQETLSNILSDRIPKEGVYIQSCKIQGDEITLAVKKQD